MSLHANTTETEGNHEVQRWGKRGIESYRYRERHWYHASQCTGCRYVTQKAMAKGLRKRHSRMGTIDISRYVPAGCLVHLSCMQKHARWHSLGSTIPWRVWRLEVKGYLPMSSRYPPVIVAAHLLGLSLNKRQIRERRIGSVVSHKSSPLLPWDFLYMLNPPQPSALELPASRPLKVAFDRADACYLFAINPCSIMSTI